MKRNSMVIYIKPVGSGWVYYDKYTDKTRLIKGDLAEFIRRLVRQDYEVRVVHPFRDL